MDNLELRLQVERLLGVERVADARKALRREPDSESALLVQTLLAITAGKHAAAEQTLSQLIARDPRR